MEKEKEDLNVLVSSLLNKGNISGKIVNVIPVSGDASGRRYYRIQMEDSISDTFILMRSLDLKGPIVSSKIFINPNDVFFELSPFLRAHKYYVPKIYAKEGLDLLLEDAGDVPLWHFTLGKESEAEKKLVSCDVASFLEQFYKKCIDLILTLQAIPEDKEILAFQRSFSFNEYYTESRRFIDYYLNEDDKYKNLSPLVDKEINQLAERIALHPKVLVHRDFMPWNIHISQELNPIVIDYQDMLLGSCMYDIVSLLHDRDADVATGDKHCRDMAQYFFTKSNINNASQMYHEAVLQRYLRLAGQFNLLTKKTLNPIYQSWVPGCLTRVGRSLGRLKEFANLADILSVIPEVRQGLDTPWDF